MQDFSYEKYRYIIQQIKQQYAICGSELVVSAPEQSSAFLRHDVDFSLEYSKIMALIEAEEKVKATYYIMLCSPFYDFRQKHNLNIIHDIYDMGHQIGLHYDSEYLNDLPPTNHERFLETLLEQKQYLEKTTGLAINTFSLHNPTYLLEKTFNQIKNNRYYYEMTNVYYKFLNNNIKYNSDSNGYWRYESIDEVIDPVLFPYLHLLLHPFWWSNPDLSPREKVENLLGNQSNKILETYDLILKNENRINK